MQSCGMECDITKCCRAPGKRTNKGATIPSPYSNVCVCSAQSCFKLMEVCQRPPVSGKVPHGSLEPPLSQHGQASLPTTSALTASTGEQGKPEFNPRTYNQTNGSVQPAAKRLARSEVGKSMSCKKEQLNCRINRCAETEPFHLICKGAKAFEKVNV